MSLRERLLKTIRGEKADRVPLMLDGFLYNSREEIDKETDPGRREIGLRVFDHCAGFVNHPAPINRYLVTSGSHIKRLNTREEGGNVTTTSEIDTPKGKLTAVTTRNPVSNTTWTVKYPVESLDDIDKIRSVPWEVPPNLAPPDTSDLSPNFHERSVLKTSVSSPFVCVAGMMPYQYFLQLCQRHPGRFEVGDRRQKIYPSP